MKLVATFEDGQALFDVVCDRGLERGWAPAARLPARSSSVVASDGVFHLVRGFVDLLLRLTFGTIDFPPALEVVIVG